MVKQMKVCACHVKLGASSRWTINGRRLYSSPCGTLTKWPSGRCTPLYNDVLLWIFAKINFSFWVRFWNHIYEKYLEATTIVSKLIKRLNIPIKCDGDNFEMYRLGIFGPYLRDVTNMLKFANMLKFTNITFSWKNFNWFI